MQPMPKVFDVVKNFGSRGLQKKTIVGRYEDSRICETQVEKPLATHSLINNYISIIV